ncbi:hypothetical protein OAL26_00430 [Flavobacteriales bacterium]|jgi:hypothetical protein|nr:hypothetical protein [Flavobacteriales bacterium]
MKMKSFFGILLLLVLSTTSCRKGEGKGGKATITGKVYVDYYNQSGSSVDNSYYARDEDVFIVYGNNTFYDDKIATHYDGSYQFDYLMPGNYTVYTYSKDVDGGADNPKILVLKEVTISDKNEIVELDDFEIDDN